ncbi:uroporphyrinogen decarboxylase/cobalamine-independent methonine synthase family protein [Corynebacterium uterequi]|uniref:Uncharacterized protein n=1 Tax=Corynebacterium uterequi TaxID=1072256 RepID=A0A0G3HC00_9CORY|nr:hypothetical protein [Corynebacterium uterequi]AKK10921.1 hypothetical protein CUTER_04580 [Corynebacterium uterequi]
MSRAYGLGPWPGNDVLEAADVIVSETGDLPHLPLIGGDAVGRTGAMLPLALDRSTRAWQLCARPQRAGRREVDRLLRDLDVCEAMWGTRELVKIQAVGPWTLVAAMELPNGHRVITDPGATREVAEALVEGIRELAASVRRRFQAATMVQVDEPLLAEVMSGSLAGVTRFETIRSVPDAAERLREVVDGVGTVVAEVTLGVRSSDAPWQAIIDSGVSGVVFDSCEVRGTQVLDAVAAMLSAGVRPSLAMTSSDARAEAIRLARFFDELSLPRTLLTGTDVHAGDVRRLGAAQVGRRYAAARECAAILERDAGDL